MLHFYLTYYHYYSTICRVGVQWWLHSILSDLCDPISNNFRVKWKSIGKRSMQSFHPNSQHVFIQQHILLESMFVGVYPLKNNIFTRSPACCTQREAVIANDWSRYKKGSSHGSASACRSIKMSELSTDDERRWRNRFRRISCAEHYRNWIYSLKPTEHHWWSSTLKQMWLNAVNKAGPKALIYISHIHVKTLHVTTSTTPSTAEAYFYSRLSVVRIKVPTSLP